MELSKNYEPRNTEEKWTKHWHNQGYFNSVPDDREAYVVVIPPPNVTGVLHMGHTLNETVQDILVRKARMSGFNACWVPGSDHASIATEAKVVQMLKEKGIDKNNLSRAEFLAYAFEWKEKYGGIIYNQIEKLGCSVDWKRVTFTMDDHYYKAVIKVFVDLYRKGLIYRGARMINWDPAAKTALSDEEVEFKDVQGTLYYIQYALADDDEQQLTDVSVTDDSKEADIDVSVNHQLSSDNSFFLVPSVNNQQATTGYITIATQRPETIMGDTAICVNPNDERYTHLAGSYAIVPLINKKIPIIFDAYVDASFGTGALKVTPAHDINDYNLGLKHNLPVIDTLNEDGTLSEAAQIYIGEDRFAARKKIVADLKANGHLLKQEEYQTRLGYSQRSGAVVEPRISTQWFVNMKQMAEPALKAVTDGDITIHPGDRFLATYKYWLENVKDWCISRQLWWGQQIPAWYGPDGSFVVAETREEALQQFNIQNSKFNIEDLTQDEDVLDTWFSSWLWPMEVFKGISAPANKEIDYYYPTAVLVTGQDIIFFWVARMIMAGMHYKNKRPFKHVYFTGMVRDKQGRKMSKQLGNSPDLLMLIDKYGADAVRFGIMISSPAGNDLLFDEASLEQGRNFNNKIWNALKLIKMWQGRQAGKPLSQPIALPVRELEIESELLIANNEVVVRNFAIDWFENRLNQVTAELEILYNQFKLSEGLKTIYSLIWDDFCSWYLEWIKPGFEQPVEPDIYERTVDFFERLMQLLHPYMPFVTEEIHHLLRQREAGDDIAVKQFASVAPADKIILTEGELLKTVITAIRDARNKNQVKPKDGISLFIQTHDKARYNEIAEILQRQVNASDIAYTSSAPANTIVVTVQTDKFYFESGKQINATALKEELEKDLLHQQQFFDSVTKKLSNTKFMAQARPDVVELERKKQADALARINAIQQSLATL